MTLAITAVIGGLIILVISADRFVEGAAAAARHLGMPPLLIGIVIVGLGTSAPEMVVSAISALQGNPGLALGNAYGSNIANLGLILGLTALFGGAIPLQSRILRKELPVLTVITILSALLLMDGTLSRPDAVILLMVFSIFMGWTILQGLSKRRDTLAREVTKELKEHAMTFTAALFWLIVGMLLLVVSSRILVWGAVEVARYFGISDLLIGLSVVAIGTSLPELAASIIAVRKGEHDLAIGNVIGSNLFNTLAVVGIAGAIHPMGVSGEVLYRDVIVMGIMTVSIFIMGYGFFAPGRISRLEGSVLLGAYVAYMVWIGYSMIGA